ncbi:tRNA (adenosine(37)-N6)-threonylcarbamoyltransferase complex dimerization subunit type 1 TsaB [Pseudonocardia acaciae]|uniref:tRNA (adenosine(37)-N6)-threonylcarbamoyltransferase complex dimerization subunit type 1 TsaB n=1 Tax=Pseudonocardia acaciae TaxID=551276 RepID=UPI000490A6DC|nr:tRNA (adenosine(37)-N6)-threonylcarbamoyltransferase complex dimerization subunit type 1 TsaB [Pseudonocardia acaciae]
MLVLALDTATDAVVVGLLTLPEAGEAGGPAVLAERAYPGARRHGEQLMPAVREVCAEAGRRLDELDAVVCGAGPGPFTGLRVGLVSAASMGDALDVPVYGVCSLDAVAAAAQVTVTDVTDVTAEPLLVVADARRRELYWAAYDEHGRRTEGPAVDTPAALAEKVAGLGVRRVAGPVAAAHADALGGLPECPPAAAPTPYGLVTVAEAELRARATPAPLEPYYLRRPDAVPPGPRKRATPARAG